MPDREIIEALAEQIRSGDPVEARRALEPWLSRFPAHARLGSLEAELLLRERRPGAALRALEAANAAGGETAGRLVCAGRCLNTLGRLGEAEEAFRRALELDAGHSPALAGLGHVLKRMRRPDEAEAMLRRAIEIDPSQGGAMRTLGVLYLDGGRHEDAAGVFRRALAADGEDPELLGYLGVALHKGGRLADAEGAYRRALALAPTDLGTLLNLGITLQDAGRLEDAIAAYAEAADCHPSSAAALHRLADARLAAGHCMAALEATGKALVLDPGHPSAIAARIVALQRLGRSDEAAFLSGMDRLVRQVDPDPPPGFESAAAFNEALVEHILHHPTLAYEPDGHATRLGRHTKDLLVGDKGPAGDLESVILEAVDRYLASLDMPTGHPFPGTVPRPHRLAMWAVVMDTDGHQLPHVHPSAWLSGVYYPQLPASLGRGGDDVAGWIEFGLPAEEFCDDAEVPVRLFRPREGSMFLFPSYLYHRTIPFGGNARRVSVAFDVLRRPAV